MRAAVFFDVGETLVNESRLYEEWADYLGVPRLTFLGALGAAIERRQHHREAFRMFEPDLTIEELLAKREQEGRPQVVSAGDLYPDAIHCLENVRAAGYTVGVVGNQPASVHRVLLEALPRVDVLATSEDWGIEKPAPEFFARIQAEVDLPPERIAYVGDRVDNDIVPAAATGMIAVFVRRGPWGVIQAEWPEVSQATLQLTSLNELPEALASVLPPAT